LALAGRTRLGRAGGGSIDSWSGFDSTGDPAAGPELVGAARVGSIRGWSGFG
jgi:hypothetical protein